MALSVGRKARLRPSFPTPEGQVAPSDERTHGMTDKETFRHVIGHFASGVTVLTTRAGDEDFGATASAVS